MANNLLKISSDGVFYSLQGEGTTMGKPAVFLRLHLCNLRCVWCDTRYTWDQNSEEFWTDVQGWTVEETAKVVKEAWECEDEKVTGRLVITGGEPLLQQDNIARLLDLLPDWQIEIETNGTIRPAKNLLQRCQFNCSPKLSNSFNARQVRIKPGVIKMLKTVNTIFKFVVANKEDVVEAEKDYIKPFEIPSDQVLIMPQGVSNEEIRENAKKVVDCVKQRGYRLLLRLHVDLWGDKRRT